MKWNGRDYRPPMGRRIYPPRQESITELLKPLAEKSRKGNVWVPVLNQPLNVQKPDTSPAPPVSASPTPTGTPTSTPTPTSSSIPPSPSPTGTPTQTPTGTPTPTPTASALPAPSVTYIETQDFAVRTTNVSWSQNWTQAGLVVLVISQFSQDGNNNINSVTLGGNAMTLASNTFREDQYGSGYRHTAIYYLNTASTSGTISIVTAINVDTSRIGVYRIDNASSSTPVYSNSTLVNGTSVSLTTTSIADGSIGIGGMTMRDAGSCGSTYTNWTRNYYTRASSLISSSGNFVQSGAGTRTVSVSQICGAEDLMLNLAVWR